MTRDCNLLLFTANEIITDLMQYILEVSQEESNLLKGGLYFLIQPDKIRKSKIFTRAEDTHLKKGGQREFKKMSPTMVGQ